MTSSTTSIESASDRTDSQSERDPPVTSPTHPTRERIRTVVFYLSLALTAALTIAVLRELLGLLVTGWTAEAGAELGIHRLHVMGIATVVGVFLLGLLSQAYRPERRVATMWGAFALIAVVTVGTIGLGVGRPEEVIPFMLLASVALVAHPAGRGLVRRGDSYSPALLALVVVAAIPLLAFGVNQILLSAGGTDSHAVEGHYLMMAALALAPLVYGIPAALGVVGWRPAGWLAALPMAYYGLLSISFPAQAGSTGMLWGSAAILWAVAFVVVVELSRDGASPTFRREVQRRDRVSKRSP